MFAEDQLTAFNTDGFVRLPGAMAADEVRDMYERLWSLLERRGALRDDPATWREAWRAGAASHLHAIRRGDPDPKASPVLCSALDAVFAGRDWHAKAHWGQALVTFPSQVEWALPTNWHLDHAYRQPARISGVNLFLFVDDVAERGGGTVVLRSSPLLVGRFVSTVRGIETVKHGELNRRFTESDPWLRELKGKPRLGDRDDRLMKQDTDVDGIPVRVVELTGNAGDVILCHPWLLHAAGAPNISNKPRLMRASHIYRPKPG